MLHARSDADVLFVKTLISAATHHDTAVIGDDTGLLALLYKHCPEDGRIKDKRIKDKIFYFKSVYNKRETLAQGAIYRQYIAIRSNEYIQTCK